MIGASVLTFWACVFSVLVLSAATDDIRPVANPAAVIIHENARFTVLTPSIVRMEYSATGVFDDSASIAFLNRYFDPVPTFSSSVDEAGVLSIRTDFVTIHYNPADNDVQSSVNTDGNTNVHHRPAGFAPGRLWATLQVHPFSTWTAGQEGTGNLHGTIRTLDRVGDPVNLACPKKMDMYVYYSHCEEGLVSRDGWVLVDDTLRPRMQKRGEGKGEYIDWYLFAHGDDYKLALKEFVALSGRIPMSPRYALGPAFSRWYQWSDIENLEIVQSGFASNGIPLDVLVVDMDWHYTYPRGLPNPYGVQVQGWTGHTVYPYLFPDAAHFLAYLRRRNVFVTFNHHPAAGIEFHEAVYAQFAKSLGMDAATGKTIDFDIANATWASYYFQNVIKPIDDLGMEYWWLDFQQEPFTTVPYLNPTIMCNYAWWNNEFRYGSLAPPEKARDRPFLMGRFGGLGAHRYPIGFVGDTYVRWGVLRYETYFMPTASNVAYQWTHDIGGFEGHSPSEFFTRHLQFGTFSPALRTHSSKRSTARSIWTYPQPYFSVMKRFYRLRTRLVPYIAGMQRVAYDTGLPLIRPMYYEYPRAQHVYADQALHQYFFGDDMWTAPISVPAANGTHAFNVSGAPVTEWTLWLPPGRWVEWFTFQLFDSPSPDGQFISRNYSLAETPVFSRPGAIIPMRTLPAGTDVLGLSSQVPDALTFTVFGGVAAGEDGQFSSSTRLYDDDGHTVAYQDGIFSWSDIACQWSKGASVNSMHCTLSPPEGPFAASLPKYRTYDWRFVSTYLPSSVVVNGVPLQRDSLGVPDAHGENAAWAKNSDAWGYEGSTLSTWVHLGSAKSTSEIVSVILEFPAETPFDDPLLSMGLYRKVQRALACKDEIDRVYGALFPSDVESMLNVTAATVRMSVASDAHAVKELLESIDANLRATMKTAKSWRIPAGHPVKQSQLRCSRALKDAVSSYTVLETSDPRYRAATSELTYKYEVGEHLQVPEPTGSDV